MAHYLDYNATAPVRESVRDAIAEALALPGNPSSVHAPGRAARALVENARERIAAFMGARPHEVVFTGSGSEANNLALSGPRPVRIMASAIEHPSVLRPAAEWTGGFDLLAVDGRGVVDLEALEQRLAAHGGERGPVLVTVMAANNETGVIQPVSDVVRIARAAGALVHCDAVQAAGRTALDFAALGCDLMSLSAHKLGGPKGVGALICRDGLDLAPLIKGGGQERGLRAGTENVPGIAGFAAAVEAVSAELAGDELSRQRALRDGIEAAVRETTPEAVVVGAGAERLANTSCIAWAGRKAETLVIAFDLEGVAVSSGSACSSGKVEASHVLAAMGLDGPLASGALRISFGYGSTATDADAFIAAWRKLAGADRPSGRSRARATSN